MFEHRLETKVSLYKQPIIYNGQNLIITQVRKGKDNQPLVFINMGFTIHDPFSGPVPDIYSNANVYAFYYKLTDPQLLPPKRRRVWKLLKKEAYLFGCCGLKSAGKELIDFLQKLSQKTSQHIILVGHSKSATMLLESAKHIYNKDAYSIVGISPIFSGTFSTMPDVLREYLGFVYTLVGGILTEHQVDEDIKVGSKYLKEADFSACEGMDIHLVLSSLDSRIPHRITDVIKPHNWFRLFSGIMDKIIEDKGMYGNYRCDCFVPFVSQYPPPFYLPEENITYCYSSLAGSFRHPKTQEVVNNLIREYTS